MNINGVNELLTIVLDDENNVRELVKRIDEMDTKRKKVIFNHTNKLLELNSKIINEDSVDPLKNNLWNMQLKTLAIFLNEAIPDMKETINMTKKTDGKKVERIIGIPKLEDALLAGTKKSNECFLILTEGDSAKGLAMAGREISGLDKFGIYPLKGKLLNTRNSTNSKIFNNTEINDLKKILGLKHNDNMK